MSNLTEKLLKQDSLQETEDLLGGKHWSEFNEDEQMLSLAKSMHDNKTKADHLKSIKDTYWGINWDEFKEMLFDFGFEIGLSYQLKERFEGNEEEAIIYFHKEKGLILWATSYNKKTSINGGTCYGEIKPNDEKSERTIQEWMSTGGKMKNGIYKTSFDIREGLFYRLSMLESAGEFKGKWTNKDRFLWFLDWNDEKIKDYDYKEITKEKISMCDPVVNEIINGNVDQS